MVTGRELFTKFLRDEPLPRPPFVPMLRGLVSRVEGVPMETIMSDPTLWANSLVKTYKLFRFDGVVVGLDFTLMAEACGCGIAWEDDRPRVLPPANGLLEDPQETGRMKHALETAGRVFEVSRKEQACIATMTGPVTLASYLFGDEWPNHLNEVKQRMVQVAEAFCRTGPDALIFLERRPLASVPKITLSHRKIYNTLKNISEYYDVRNGLYLQGYDPNRVDDFRALGLDIYILGPSADGSLPPVPQVWDLGVGALGVGLGLPLNDPARARELIQDGRKLYKTTGGRGIFFTSFGPATRDTDLEALHGLVDEIFKL